MCYISHTNLSIKVQSHELIYLLFNRTVKKKEKTKQNNSQAREFSRVGICPTWKIYTTRL